MCTKFWLENLKGRDHVKDRHRWEDNIRMDLKEIGWGDVDCILLAQDMDWWWGLVNTVMNLWVLLKGREFLDKLSGC
jgi:hypothetical protein